MVNSRLDQLGQAVHSFVEDHLYKKTFPGVEILVARKEEVLLHRAWGYVDRDQHEILKKNQVFDLASLSKPLVTSLVVSKLFQDNRLRPDSLVSDYIPEWKEGKDAEVNILQLLTHTSGLPGWVDLYSETKQGALLEKLYNLSLDFRPGEKVVYSCLGFILLSEVVRRITGEKLKDFCRKEVYRPLQVEDGLLFSPVESKIQTIPTEVYIGSSKGLVNQVHDENCRALDGDGGNAGLFGSVKSVSHLLWKLLRIYHGREKKVFHRDTIQKMWKNHLKIKPARALGWDYNLKDQGYMSCGTRMPEGTVGHTGFTGTSLWLVPDEELMILVMSNRVNISRTGNLKSMMQFRAELHDMVWEKLS